MARIDDVCTVLWLREGWWPVGELPGPLVLAEADPWGADTVRAAARSGWQVLRRGARFAEIDCRAGSLLLVDSAFEVGHGVAAALAAANAGIAFADEQGFHKPAWNLDLALEQDLVGGVCLIGRGLLAGRAELGVEAPHDVALRLSGVAGGAALVPVVGGVWRGERRVQPGIAAVRAVLPPGAKTVPSVLRLGRFRIAREVTGTHPMVSVVVPTKDNPAMLRRCLEGVLRRTAYPAIEVVVADNGAATPEGRAVLEEVAEDARVRVVSVPGAFNYAHINNVAATVATGEVLVLMNDDVDVIAPGWLAEMVGHALRPEVGAVGAKLLYPDGTVQHGGIVLGVGAFEGGAGIAGHFGLGEAGGASGYGDQLVTTREVSAVTGACLAVRRDVWRRLGGMDAVNLPVALNDLDFCLRAREAGFIVVWTPYAVLRHDESASRGSDMAGEARARFMAECRWVDRRWRRVLDRDPFYNPNFSRYDHSFQLAPP